MNIKRIIAIAAAAAMLALSAACGSNTASSSSSEPKADTTSPTGYYSDDIIAAVDGPQLMFSNASLSIIPAFIIRNSWLQNRGRPLCAARRPAAT